MKYLVLRMLKRLGCLPWLGDRLHVMAEQVFYGNGGGVHDFRIDGEEALVHGVARVCPEQYCLVLLDVGANRGDWTMTALRTTADNAVVPVFEPISATFLKLAEGHGSRSDVVLNTFALSDTTGETERRVYPLQSTANSLVAEPFHALGRHRSTDATMTGDEYCAENGVSRVSMLKIDTEGFEWNVLTGFRDMLCLLVSTWSSSSMATSIP